MTLPCTPFLSLLPRTLFAVVAAGLLTCLPAYSQCPGRDWERMSDGEAKAAGWSREKLTDAQAYSRTINTEAVMVVLHGKVLAEWGPVDKKFNIHSIRKSFLSALCGIRAGEGKLKLDATMADLGIDDNAPSLSDSEKKATVRELLEARSGIYHPALYETARMKEKRPARSSHAPGTFWYYNNWDFNALGTIYEKCSGDGIYDDLERLIAAPIGMQDYSPADGKYVTGDDSIHRAYPIRMTARDMARFGLLYLRNGNWNGRQVVPGTWVKESLIPYSETGASGGYGYLWWLEKDGRHLPGVTLPAGSYSARGAGGHYILVIPALDLVIVHRVNTDIEGRRVEEHEFGMLVRKILEAHASAAPDAATPKLSRTLLMGEAAAVALDAAMPALQAKFHVPGVAVIKLEDHRIAWERYYGVRTAGKEAKVDADTVFEVASMSKPLLAYAAMKLVEAGRLDLDRPLDSYLPKPYLPEQPLAAKITARMVMNHTTGFPNWRPKGGGKLIVEHEPGTKFTYSGEGIDYLQRVVEQITGEDYEAYIQRTLMKPAGMAHSSHVWQPSFGTTAAAGHDLDGKTKANRNRYTKANAAYSLYTTARDYAAFLLEMMAPDRGRPWQLRAASLQAMFTPTDLPTGRMGLTRQGAAPVGPPRVGLVWWIEPTAHGPIVRHSGSNGTGFRSHCEFDPATGDGLLILTNSYGGEKLHPEVVKLIGEP